MRAGVFCLHVAPHGQGVFGGCVGYREGSAHLAESRQRRAARQGCLRGRPGVERPPRLLVPQTLVICGVGGDWGPSLQPLCVPCPRPGQVVWAR